MGMPDQQTDRVPNSTLAILYVVAVAGYALIATVPVALDLGNRLFTVPFRALVLALSLWVVVRAAREGELYTGVLWLPLTVFWLLYTGRILWDTLINPVPLGYPASEYFLYALGTCFVPMLAFFARPNDATLSLALRLTTTGCAVAVLAVAFIAARLVLAGNIGTIITGRLELRTLNPISFGHLGTSLIIVSLFQFRARPRSPASVLALTAALILGILAVGLSASKGPILALAAGLVLLMLLDWRSGRPFRAVTAGVLILFLGIQGAFYLEEHFGFAIISRFQVAMDDPLRTDLMSGAVSQFLAHPFTGSSLEERVLQMYPHNTFLESFMAVGLVGGLAYSVFHLGALREAWRLIVSRPEHAWVAILCVQYTIAASFSGALWDWSMLWSLLAAVVAVRDSAVVVRESQTRVARDTLELGTAPENAQIYRDSTGCR